MCLLINVPFVTFVNANPQGVYMHKETVISHFGGVVNTAVALGIKHPAVSRWGRLIPEKQAMKIERLTDGKLKYQPELYMDSTVSAA